MKLNLLRILAFLLSVLALILQIYMQYEYSMALLWIVALILNYCLKIKSNVLLYKSLEKAEECLDEINEEGVNIVDRDYELMKKKILKLKD